MIKNYYSCGLLSYDKSYLEALVSKGRKAVRFLNDEKGDYNALALGKIMTSDIEYIVDDKTDSLYILGYVCDSLEEGISSAYGYLAYKEKESKQVR